MARTFIGASSFDEARIGQSPLKDSDYAEKNYWFQRSGAIDAVADPGEALGPSGTTGSYIQITAIGGGVHGSRSSTWFASTRRFRTYTWALKVNDIIDPNSPTSHPIFGFMFTGPDADSDVVGQTRVEMECSTEPATPQYRLRLAANVGGAWGNASPWGAWQNENAAWVWWTIVTDRNTDARRYKLIKDFDWATPYSDWTSVGQAFPLDTTPSLGNTIITQPGKDENIITWWGEVFGVAADTEAETQISPHVFTRHGVGDKSPTSLWTATGNAAACSSDRWRAVDDLYDSEDGANDYVSEADAGEADQMFEVGDLNAGATAVYGVVAAAAQLGSTGVDSIIFRDGDAGSQVVKSALLGTGNGIGSHKSATLPDKPGAVQGGGTGWAVADFNNLQVGLRSAANNAGKVYCFTVHVLCDGGANPANAPACAVAAAFTPKVMVF